MATQMATMPYEQQKLHSEAQERVLMMRGGSRATWATSLGAGGGGESVSCWGGGGISSSQAAGGNNNMSTWSKRAGMSSAMDTESWEVRAFAEDASSSGQWPPRSYSCSFCQREFRTAQALGGHMNVHRRERAHANQLTQLRNASASTTASLAKTTSRKESGQENVNDANFSWLHAFPSTVPEVSPLCRISSNGPKTPDRAACSAAGRNSGCQQSTMLTSDLSLSGSAVLRSSCGLQASACLSTSPPSQDSISSSSTTILTTMNMERSAKRLLESIPLTFEDLSGDLPQTALASGAFHPYGKSPKHSEGANLRRFSMCFSKAMGDDDSLDLELRLGLGPCTV